MTMTPGLRKFMLTVHIAVSVGWIGAAFAYIGIVVAALSSPNAQTVGAAWIDMESVIRFVLVPAAFASLLTGLIMSLGTRWGLFRHYWVLLSFLLTIVATVVLLTQVEVIGYTARQAAGPDSAASRGGLAGSLLHPGGGLVVLLVVLVLNVYKPQGMTPYGLRKQQEQREVS